MIGTVPSLETQNTALFWCLFGLMVLVITIPLFALTYYNLQFFYEVRC